MRFSTVAASVAILASSAVASPVAEPGRGYGHNGGSGSGKWYMNGKPVQFSSTYSVVATPDQVVNGTEYTGGLPGAIGYYDFGINRRKNIICYDITLYGFRGEYESAALTSTHIHEAAKGQSGPPRLAFPNPKRVRGKNVRKSKGCLQGPFETGILDTVTGVDTGKGFRVGQIENNPEGFFCDVHSSLAVPGAVRGQLDD